MSAGWDVSLWDEGTWDQPLQTIGGHFGYDEKKRGKLWDVERKNEKQRKKTLRLALFGLPPEEREIITSAPIHTIERAARTQIDYEAVLQQVRDVKKQVALKKLVETEQDEKEIEMLLL